jgi:Cys-tRNA(Pro)/Cys-tRNA(Cys) deacylase
MSTRAIIFLKKNNTPFEVVKYEHLQKGAAFAAGATGFPLEQTVKTLVVGLDKKTYCLVLVPGDCRLDLKTTAAHCNAKRAEMADSRTAERITGYPVGGISPFGTRQRLPVIMEACLRQHAQVLINAGRRGIMLKMAVRDIERLLGCKVAAVAGPAS